MRIKDLTNLLELIILNNSYGGIDMTTKNIETSLEAVEHLVSVLQSFLWIIHSKDATTVYAIKDSGGGKHQFNVELIEPTGPDQIRPLVSNGYIVTWFNPQGQSIGTFYPLDTESLRSFTRYLRGQV